MAKDLLKAIQGYKCHRDLLELWKKRNTDAVKKEWPSGKLLEFVVLRAFELEDASVTYPFSVWDDAVVDNEAKMIQREQLDGAVYVDSLHTLIECKDYAKTKDPINVDALAKLKFRLSTRPSNVFGMFFSTTDYTHPAELLLPFMRPETIILWCKDDIECCLKYECFVECMRKNIEWQSRMENTIISFTLKRIRSHG